MKHLTQLMNDLFTTGGVLIDRRGAKRYSNDRIKNTDSCQRKEERFLNRFVKCIDLVHTELRKNNYDGYRLSDGEIKDIQDSVLCKNYTLSPMRLVSRIEQTQEYKNDFCELEGSFYDLPYVNTDNKILRRFPVDILINILPMSYYGLDIVTPHKLSSDKRNHYIKSSIQDNIVIAAFIIALLVYLGESKYFRKKSYDNYYDNLKDVQDAYIKSQTLSQSLILELKLYKWLYSRSRLIEKMAPFVNSEEYLMSIIHSLLNLNILDEAGRDISSKTGSPMIPILDDFLFNIFLDDIDQKIEDHLPDIQFTRLQSEIIIPVTDEKDKESEKKILEATLLALIKESFGE